MNLLHALFIANNIFLCIKYGNTATDKYLSTIEAALIGVSDLCLGDCVGWNGKEECIYDWEENVGRCSILMNRDKITPKKTKRYRTIHNELCHSNCGKYNENYDWCVTKRGDTNIFDWNYCNRKNALKGTETYRTKDKYLTCVDACARRSNSSHWCHTIKESQYCDPTKKVIVFNFMSESGKECTTPCELYYGIPHCYDLKGDWKKCFLNPDSTNDLTQIAKHMNESRNPGVYLKEGYKRCQKVKISTLNPINIEEVARDYEDNFPTITVRYLDHKNLITNDHNPVFSYTVYNTFSNFGDHQVNLPLAIRAIITNNTLRRDINNEITNHYNDMNPINVDKKFDVKGHLVAFKLGGPTEIFNIFPQSSRQKNPLSGWSYMEDDIYNFINTIPNSYAEYTVVLSYNLTDTTRPFRPTAVGLRVRLYKAFKKGTVVDGANRQLCDVNGKKITTNMNVLENMYFSNDPNFNCIIDNSVVGNNAF